MASVGVVETVDVLNQTRELRLLASQNATNMKQCCRNNFLVLQDNCIEWMQEQGEVSLFSNGLSCTISSFVLTGRALLITINVVMSLGIVYVMAVITSIHKTV